MEIDKDDIYFAVGTALGLLAFFGIDWKVFSGRASDMPLNQPLKNRLMVAAIFGSLILSIVGWSQKPKEKIVEKPVDRIVEKIVEKDCQQSASVGKSKKSTPPSPPMSQECHGGDCAQSYGQSGGITAGRVEVNTPPKRTLTETQKQGIKDFLQNIPQTVLITVGSVYGSGDGDMYANQFFPLFDGRHYEHQSAASIRTGFPAEFTGVFVATVTEDDPAVAYRDAFVRKLADLGINAAASNGSKVTKGNLELIIGYRPEEVKER
jgi:hypothetical protein